MPSPLRILILSVSAMLNGSRWLLGCESEVDDGKAQSQKLSELPLVMSPVLAGMILFGLSFRGYESRISYANKNRCRIPSAHFINWLAVTEPDDLNRISRTCGRTFTR